MKIPSVRLTAGSSPAGRRSLGRRRSAEPEAPTEIPAGAHPLGRSDRSDRPADVRPNRPTGKGRPTPKRSDAQRRRRGPAAAPANRKEANRLSRDQARIKRQDAREGLRRGDERYLPARDAGPVRRAVRDVVDSRRNALSLFLVAAVILFLGTLVRVPLIGTISVGLWFLMLIVMIADSVWLGLIIRRTMRERFPDSGQRTGGLVFYGITRASQMRRLRVPPPKVTVGGGAR